MFARIGNSWELVKASAAVLSADKELIIYPIVSSIGVLIVTISFALPFLLTDLLGSFFAGGSQVLGYVVLFFFYLAQYIVVIFANSALVGAAMIRLEGGDPTLSDGFRIAWSRLGTIFLYAVISATVGMILRWLSERSNTLGRFASSIVGLAWNLATFLAVPVLVVEDVGPLEAVKRSAELLKKTWGEQIVGNFSIGLIFGLITFALILVDVPLIILAVSIEAFALIFLIVGVTILALIALGFVSSTLTGIYTAAVYQYARTGETAPFFREELVTGAFRMK